MKKLLPAICLLFAFGAKTQAQDQTKKERIQYLFMLMRQDSMMNKMAANMAASFSRTMKNMHQQSDVELPGVDSLKMAKIMSKAIGDMNQLMKNDMVEIYGKHFTSAEIEDYITFYKSKSGQKMIQETPDITKDIMTAMATKYQPTMVETIKKEMQEN